MSKKWCRNCVLQRWTSSVHLSRNFSNLFKYSASKFHCSIILGLFPLSYIHRRGKQNILLDALWGFPLTSNLCSFWSLLGVISSPTGGYWKLQRDCKSSLFCQIHWSMKDLTTSGFHWYEVLIQWSEKSWDNQPWNSHTGGSSLNHSIPASMFLTRNFEFSVIW